MTHIIWERLFRLSTLLIILSAGQMMQLYAAPPQKKPAQAAAKSVSNASCGSRASVQRFVVDASGSVNDSGRTFEGPVCIEVFYNPIQIYLSLATNTTT